MAGFKATQGARASGPAGAGAAAVAVVAGVKTETGDFDEAVAGFGVDRDVFATTGGTVAAEAFRGAGAVDETGATEHVRDGTGAVVTDIGKRAMPAAVAVGLIGKGIASVEGTLNTAGEVGRRDGVEAAKGGGFAALVLISPLRWASGTGTQAGEQKEARKPAGHRG